LEEYAYVDEEYEIGEDIIASGGMPVDTNVFNPSSSAAKSMSAPADQGK
jgi:hypothetical protein